MRSSAFDIEGLIHLIEHRGTHGCVYNAKWLVDIFDFHTWLKQSPHQELPRWQEPRRIIFRQDGVRTMLFSTDEHESIWRGESQTIEPIKLLLQAPKGLPERVQPKVCA